MVDVKASESQHVIHVVALGKQGRAVCETTIAPMKSFLLQPNFIESVGRPHGQPQLKRTLPAIKHWPLSNL